MTEISNANPPMDVRLFDTPWNDKVEVRIQKGNSAAKTIVMEPHYPGEYVAPVVILSKGEVQALFNQLWQMGYRPKDGTGNGGHVEAIKYHLEDMRKLVFKS